MIKYILIGGIILLLLLEIMRRLQRTRKHCAKKSRKHREAFQDGGDMSGKKIAVLIRGYSDKRCKKTFRKNIYQPLKNAGWDVDVYMTTYGKENEAELRTYPGIKDVFFQEGGTQVQTYIKGLSAIPDTYDLYLVVRFDLNYKKPVTEWMPKTLDGPEQVWVLWREYESLWNEHRRVSDTVHFMTPNGRKAFIDVISKNEGLFMGDMHMLYDVLNPVAKIGILVDGFFDSNPSKGPEPEMKNPVYIFHKRPYSHNDGPAASECD
jgi:hypothetical protein